jgi:hypothetical protein
MPDWQAVLSRYATRTGLATSARGLPFTVESTSSALLATPSSGIARRIAESEFRRYWDPDSAGAPGTSPSRMTRNASYLEAIAADLGSTWPRPATVPAAPRVRPPGDSNEQRQAEPLILAAVSAAIGIALRPNRLVVVDGIAVNVDGFSNDPPVLVEVWAHQGAPKPAQKAKVMSDAVKMLWIERVLFPAGARKILALADPVAAGHFRGRTWMATALRDLGLEVMVIELTDEIRAGLLTTQRRQVR